jgi:hypothetical protein
MMEKKKRRRRKPEKRQQVDNLSGGGSNQTLAKGTVIIDDFVLRLLRYLNIRIKRSLFKEFGYQCAKCEWATRKNGINGRNAVRAHSKKHKNEQRALSHLRVQYTLGVGLLLAVLLTSAWSFAKPVVPSIATSWLTSSTLIGSVLLGTSTISGYFMFGFQKIYSYHLDQRWRTGYLLSLSLGALVLIAEALLASDVTPISVPTPWLLSGAIPVVALAYTRSAVGNAKLRSSRRGRPSTKYVRRYIARTADGDEEYDDIQLKISGVIHRGGFTPNYGKRWQRNALRAMGMRVERLDNKDG